MNAKLNVSSRFDVLKVEEGVDDSDASDEGQRTTKANQTPAKKKKNNKQKKKNDVQKGEQTGFGGKISGHGEPMQAKNEVFSDTHWAELEKREEEYTDMEFRRELSETLLHSRLQYEEMKQKSEADVNSQQVSQKNKKKKKEKSITMSLDQFSQGAFNNVHSKDLQLETHSSGEAAFLHGGNESNFFDKFDEDAAKILDQERLQLKPKPKNKTIIISPAKGAVPEETPEIKKQKKDLGIKEKEIVMLNATRKKLEDELQQVKKRNQQLLHMLGQGEMKGKTPFLMEIDDLKLIGEELTNELAKRKSELEEEKSNVLVLKAEVDKLKEIKHSGK